MSQPPARQRPEGAFRLIVTEKPSVARDIARVLKVSGGGQGWIGNGDLKLTWCLGHLVELAEPGAYDAAWRSWRLDALPMLPEVFELTPRKDTADQWRVVRGLLSDKALTVVVNACDAGREGELIFANAYRLSGSRAPVKRLWVSSMTAQAIRAGFDNLKSGREMLHLEAAARCRSEADWLVGLNATRAMTVRAQQGSARVLLSLGRVQTPTLAVMVDREDAIDEFVPEAFFQVKVRFSVEAGEWQTLWTKGKKDRLKTREEAEAILGRIQGKDGVVTKVERKQTKERPPLLYDLTSLQKEANKRFRFSAKRTLDIAQGLYEKFKVVTYPRTDSRHLSSDQVAGIPKQLEGLKFGPYEAAASAVLDRWPIKPGKRIVDDAEVSDHHAIVPTGVNPRTAGMDNDSKRVFDLVARRFLAVFHPSAVFAQQLVVTTIGEDAFVAKGRSCLEPGWRAVDPPKTGNKAEVLLPPVEVDDVAQQVEAVVHEGETKPPKRFTEATLLGAMEHAGDGLQDAELKRAMKRNGLGTPATRAAIIETLIRRDYIKRDGTTLRPTPQGRSLLSALPVPALRSPKLTGQWEARLVAMAEGEDDRPAFMADIRRFAQEAVEAIRGAELGPQLRAQVLETAAARARGGDLLGACPLCGGEVRDAGRGWSCLGEGCGLHLRKQIAGRDVSERMAKSLLKTRESKAVKGWKSRAGKPFTAGLRIEDDGNVKFFFPESPALGPCPACAKPVRQRGKVWSCDTGRDCPFVVFGTMASREVTEAEVKALLEHGRTERIDGWKQRSGSEFKAALQVAEDFKVRFDFSQPARADESRGDGGGGGGGKPKG